MDAIKEDIENIEKDIQKIRCNPIIKFFNDALKCIKDSVTYCFKSTTHSHTHTHIINK